MMAKTLTQQGKVLATKVIGLQVAIIIGATLITFFVAGEASWSLFYGGFIGILPNAYFAFQAFKIAGARQAQQVVVNMYKGEAVKLIMTVLLFVLAFKVLTVLPGWLFLGYTLALMMNWIALAMFKKSQQ